MTEIEEIVLTIVVIVSVILIIIGCALAEIGTKDYQKVQDDLWNEFIENIKKIIDGEKDD